MALPSRGTAVTIVLFVGLAGALIWTLHEDDQKDEDRADAPQVSTSQKVWDVPGFRSGHPMAVWTDPETGCQYLIMPDRDPVGLRHGVPCPNPSLIVRPPAPPDTPGPRRGEGKP